MCPGEVHALVAVRPKRHPCTVQIPLASRRRGPAWLKLTSRTAVVGGALGAISAALSVAPVLTSPQASSAAPAVVTDAGSGGVPGICRASFDVFSVSPSLLSRCGILAYPAQTMGASSASYDVAGAEVTYDVPPPSFNPLMASNGLLAHYGIPGPPAGAGARAAWAQQMKKLHFVSPPPFLVVLPSQATSTTPDYSDHWAGYVAYGGPFMKISSTWVQPSLGPTRCHPNSLTIWAGLGGYESAALAQDGTAENTPAIANNQAWWELTPKGMVPVPLYATVGSAFTADVTYLGGARFAFFMENDQTGAAWSQTETSSRGADLTTAESIAERPCLAHCYGDHATYANLSNFGTVVFKASLADGKPIGSFATYQENMDDSGSPFGHDLANPGALSAGSTAFTVRQQSCH
jgi:Peptidase A4 family